MVGDSGVGKSTLLHLLGGLDRPDRGRQVCFRGRDVSRRRRRAPGRLPQSPRRLRVSVAPPAARVHGARERRDAVSDRAARDGAPRRAPATAGTLGLGDRLDHRPGKLSGGEQQRVAIARAVAMGPGCGAGRRADGQPRSGDREWKVFRMLRELQRRDERSRWCWPRTANGWPRMRPGAASGRRPAARAGRCLRRATTSTAWRSKTGLDRRVDGRRSDGRVVAP